MTQLYPFSSKYLHMEFSLKRKTQDTEESPSKLQRTEQAEDLKEHKQIKEESVKTVYKLGLAVDLSL